ncbi:hypothetical protein ABW19_dt0204965 [Dactylella cylindrospora]|nr:hypothetical protein ABW19_dt0204965 [Dactylella cylindrospora]
MSFLRTTTLRLPRHPTILTAARNFTTTPLRHDIAKVQLIGRIGTEPEISQASNGSPMIKYTLAVNFGSGENRTTQWHRIIAFGEGTADKLQKGNKIFVEGDLRLSTYDGEDGKKHTSVMITQRGVSLIQRPLVTGATEGSE